MVIGDILSTIGNAVTSTIGWFFQVMPTPLKIFFFMFFLVFLGGFITSASLGIFYACDSTGHAYEMSSYTLNTKADIVNTGLGSCDKVKNYVNSPATNDTKVFFLFQPLVQGWNSITHGLVSASGIDSICNNLIDSGQVIGSNWRDVILHSANPVVPKQGFAVGCVAQKVKAGEIPEFNPSLKYYGVNVLDPTLWFFGCLMVLIIPAAFWWYHTILK